MKKIEWIKVTTNIFEDEIMKLIENFKNRDAIFYIWIRLLIQAGKVNSDGLIFLKEDIPYTKEMLSIIFNRPLEVVIEALEVLESFKLIEIYENNIIKIRNWEKHQNIEGMKKVREDNKERVRNYREKKKNNDTIESIINEEKISTSISDEKNCNANVTEQREKKIQKIKNKIIDKEERIKEKTNEEDEALVSDNKLSSKSLCDHKANEDLDNDDNLNKDYIRIQGSNMLKCFKDLDINIKGLTLESIMAILTIHKEKYVKMAIEKAIERNKLDMKYVNGILKNWLKEGYPETTEDILFKKSKGNNLVVLKENKLKFNNFEAREYDYDDLEKKLLGW